MTIIVKMKEKNRATNKTNSLSGSKFPFSHPLITDRHALLLLFSVRNSQYITAINHFATLIFRAVVYKR